MAVVDSDQGLVLASDARRERFEQAPEEVFKEHKLWEGWGRYFKTVPLGPDEELVLPKREEPDPEVVGFAFPLAPVEFALRNERKYPPPSEEDMHREMFKLVHHALAQKQFRRNYVLSIIYNHINRNKRDSFGWQRAFLKVGGEKKLLEFWDSPEAPAEGDDDPYTDRYWILALVGRMMGTSAESRVHLIKAGAVELILQGTKDAEEEVRDCALAGLKGLIQHPEGREVVTYNMLIECLGGRL